jgi:hypothetical protein
MENNQNEQEAPKGKEPAGQQQSFLRKAEEQLPDTTEPVEDTDALIGDVHPTDRVNISQEERNAESQNQSDASKISGEQL